jgi:hypothetical protein
VFNEPELGTVGGGVDDKSVEVDPCPSKSNVGNRVFKAQFGRRRTHNEQTLVRPCGIIYARATMFGAEAVSNFLVCHFLASESERLLIVSIQYSDHGKKCIFGSWCSEAPLYFL